MPMRWTHRSAVADQSVRESIFVRIRTADGTVGEAECPTLSGEGYVTESTDVAWDALVGELAAASLTGRIAAAHAAPAASAALADALLDAELRRNEVSLADHLANVTGMPSRTTVPWTAVIAHTEHDADTRGDAEVLGESAAAAADSGASMLKVKIVGIEKAAWLVGALRSATQLPVALDANGTLQPDDLRELDSLGLAYVEQPLAPGTPWSILGEAVADCETAVCLDESLVSLDAVADSLRADAMAVANIKPARIGGTMAAARAVGLCAAAGIDCFVGGMFELGIGRANSLAVASLAGCTVSTDLGPTDRYFERDVTDPVRTNSDGEMVVPREAGSGRKLDDEAVERHLLDRVLIAS
ncbi:MAG: enolase C-terminal domain-like protein [Microthrixaceae bacterium]